MDEQRENRLAMILGAVIFITVMTAIAAASIWGNLGDRPACKCEE